MKEQVTQEKLRLMVFKSAMELGQKVDEKLLEMYNLDKDKYTFILPINELFFDDGHLKVEINETVRGKDVFFLTDIGNYSVEYKMRGITNHTSPNDLMMQLKDGIGACCCHASELNIIMPLLYAGRQHRRNTRENLTCGDNLRDLDMISKIKSFNTFDAHDQGVEHAVHNMEFNNFLTCDVILERFINDLDKEELKNLVFVAPDNGAMGRRSVYINSFQCDDINIDAGNFFKQRDYNKLVDGKYPIKSHEYSGSDDLSGKTAIVIDDMISSGTSMFDVIDGLHKRNIAHIYIIVSYALFTKGVQRFDDYYKEDKIDGIYTTNLSYIPEEYKKYEWLKICDFSSEIAQIIYRIHNDLSVSGILRDRSESIKLLEKKFKA